MSAQSLSHAQLFVTPWTAAHQARILEWVAISFSRGIFPTQRLNLGLLHFRQILYHLNHQGRQMVNAFVVVVPPSLANALGKCQLLVDISQE